MGSHFFTIKEISWSWMLDVLHSEKNKIKKKSHFSVFIYRHQTPDLYENVM